MSNYHFYDTSALLEKANYLLKCNKNIVTSTTVLEELENIKNSSKKDENIKQMARKVINFITNFPTSIEIICFKDEMLVPIYDKGIRTITPDLKILAAAIWYDKNIAPDNIIFFTNDLSLANIANLFFGEDSICSVDTHNINYYKGYTTINMSDEEMSNFYQHPEIPITNHYINEYIFIENLQQELVDTLCWTGEKYRPLTKGVFESQTFGKIKPIKNDKYQCCAFDSLLNNQITMLKGPAGSGKSMIALSYLFSQLEKHKIDKIIIFCNTIATKNSAKLGSKKG